MARVNKTLKLVKFEGLDLGCPRKPPVLGSESPAWHCQGWGGGDMGPPSLVPLICFLTKVSSLALTLPPQCTANTTAEQTDGPRTKSSETESPDNSVLLVKWLAQLFST